MKTVKILMNSIKEYKRPSLLAPAFVTFEVIMECLIPFVTAQLVNQIKGGARFGVLLQYGVLLVVMAMISLFFGVTAGSQSAMAGCGFAKNLRKDMYYNIQNFSFENIDRFSTASLVTRLTTDVTNVQMAYMMLIRLAFRCPLMLIFSVIMSAIMGGPMALIFAITIPILAIGMTLIMKAVMPIFNRVFHKYDAMNNSVQENVNGMRVVKSFVRENYEKQKFALTAEDVCKDFTKADRILALNNPLMQFCLYIAMLLILTIGSYRIITTKGLALDVGQFSSLLVYNFQILMALMMFSMVFVMVTMATESAHRIAEVLSETSTLKNPEGHAETVVKDGSVDFEGVSFRYSKQAERDALSDIDLHIRSGETIGILGGTGSSKSSLVQLIPRLYDATTGTVKVGGINVKNYDLDSLRNQVAVVLQKNVLFSGTIKENLRWGNESATDDELIQACKMAQADEFITQFPDGYDTYIEQGGTNVSGGQKQRLCIARALLKKPKILILDDSTSAVDTKTDALIRQALAAYIPETTKIIIAQRIASVQEADRIIIMDGGRIGAMGTHDELMKTSEIYREVFESQTKSKSVEGEEGEEKDA